MNYLAHAVAQEARPDGSVVLRSQHPVGAIARNTGVWLHRWAAARPAQVAVAERSGAGWREVRYGELLELVQAVAASLLGRGLGAERPIMILSGNGVDHLILALAGQYAGVPSVALAEQYSLVPEASARLVHAAETVRPGLVFASDGVAFGRALGMECFEGAERVMVHGAGTGTTRWAALLGGDRGSGLAAAHAAVGPDTVAKIIFTSGSTAAPKGVVTTHRMLCVNQAQMLAVMPFLGERAHRIVDWLPWNHVFGGSHDVNLMLANGGSLYVDDGKPTRAGLAATIRNIKAVGVTAAFNVPLGFAQLVAAMQDDEALKRAYLGDCDLIFYAAASVPAAVWDGLRGFAEAVRGEAPPMYAGWGMSETAPAALQTHEPGMRPGNIGVPLPLVRAKLVPEGDGRYGLRVGGPNVMTAYYRDPAKTREAFDDEGYLITGDAVRFVDRSRPEAGLMFDGRIAEDFKLASGTWVRATNVRLQALQHLADIALDVVVTGHDRSEVGLLVFPHPTGTPHENDGEAVTAPALLAAVAERLLRAAAQGAGSSTRVARALVLAVPPSVSEGELTAKGSLNARRVLTLRQAMLERLYRDDDAAVILAS